MDPRSNDKFAVAGFWRASVLPQAVEVGEGLGRIQVIPSAHVERRHGDLSPLVLDVDLRPVVVVGRVAHPILPEVQISTRVLVHFDERQCMELLWPLVVVDVLGRASVRTHPPCDGDVEHDRAAGMD